MGTTDTRQRILTASLDLFNRDGVRRATTNHIAAHAGISPGNLYYHFRSREEIVRELFPEVARATRQTIVLPPPGAALSAREVARYHLSGIEVLWRFRFFFRDLNEIVSRDRAVARGYRALQDWLVSAFQDMFERLTAQGSMRRVGSPAEVKHLAENAALVWTSWVNFLMTAGKTAVERDDIVAGASHGLLTFSAYLDAAFAREIRTAMQRWRAPRTRAVRARRPRAPRNPVGQPARTLPTPRATTDAGRHYQRQWLSRAMISSCSSRPMLVK